MKTALKLSFILVAGALLLAASPTQANVQPAQELRAAPAATTVTNLQTAQAKKTACPEGTRWSEGAKMCVKKR